jgi:hypothetical protein
MSVPFSNNLPACAILAAGIVTVCPVFIVTKSEIVGRLPVSYVFVFIHEPVCLLPTAKGHKPLPQIPNVQILGKSENYSLGFRLIIFRTNFKFND